MNELVVITPEPTQEYVSLVSHIANLWEDARYQLYLPNKEELQAQLNYIIDNQ